MLLLAVLSGSGWLLTDAFPSEIGSPFAGCIHCTLIGCVGLVLSRGVAWPSAGRMPSIAAAGLSLFVLPSIGLELTAGGISPFTSAALFCSIPLLIVLGSVWRGVSAARALLMPSLTGLLGALLLFPLETPHTTRRILCFVAIAGCCALVAAASLWLPATLRGVPIACAVTSVGFAGALALGLYGAIQGWPRIGATAVGFELLRCAVLDLPVVWLTLWLARSIEPGRLAARFFLAPLATVIEGYALVRAPLDSRRVAALAVLAAGAAMLLLRNPRDESEELRGLHLR